MQEKLHNIAEKVLDLVSAKGDLQAEVKNLFCYIM
jgi:hypothetical protein